ncbi:hypothetical protein LWI28_010431 [Acer negundo]|uniref:Cytochrome P450 n=1 Tax=Acer negundo TaxID=4023 RepID=A0AAD5JID6_ACENE|nr:hypothetical protein LWI28_010431 [Acer negundo]KAK4854543.1 hypothetical protein QYF36_025620 [Acer negundo]
MENCTTLITTLLISSASLVFYGLMRVVYVVWWKPKSLERQLRQQGIKGTSFNLLQFRGGDMKKMAKVYKETWSKPMSLNHHIAPYVLPSFHQMVQKYGKVSLSWIQSRPRVLLADPELSRLILSDKSGHFIKPPVNPLADILQKGITTFEGEKWAKRRKLITPAFHLENLKGMVPAFSSCCVDLINKWKKSITSSGTCEIDVAPEFQNFAGDVIARTAFGSCFEEGKMIFELQKEQLALSLEAFQSIYFPGLRFIPTKKNRRRYNIDKVITETLQDMIRKREQAMQVNGEFGNNDLLDLLLRCKEQSGKDLTIEGIIEECKLFYIAGKETTANWLTWTMIVLSMHTNWQEKAREEVLRTCGKNAPNIENLNNLKIVSMIMNEVLRLYPPVIAQLRHTIKKTNIGGMTIPSGVDIWLPTLFFHHDPEYWGDDAGEFKPERFAQGVSKATKNQQNAFYPFGWGPRFCLGQNFAMIEAKMALTMILQTFSFKLSPSYTHSPFTLITLQPQHGAPIILHQL